MGTGYIPGPDIGGALAQLGQGIADILNPNAERDREIENLVLTEPEIGKAFAAAQREAQREFEAQSQELLQDPSRVADVDVQVEPPNVLSRYGFDQAKTEELLKIYPEDEAERLANFRREEGVARLQAESEAMALKAKISTDRFQSRLAKAKSDLNIPELEAYSSLLKTDLDIDLSEEGKDRLSRWIQLTTELAESDDPKDQAEFRRLQFAMNSEAFLRDIQFKESIGLDRERLGLGREQLELEKGRLGLERERLSFQQNLAEIDTAKDFADRQIKIQDLKFKAQDKFNIEQRLLNEALAEGTQEAITAAIVGFNNAAAQLRSLSPEGTSLAVDAKVGAGGFLWLGKKIKGVRLTVLAPGNMHVSRRFRYEQFMDAFASADPDTPFAEDMQLILDNPEGVAFIESLTPEQRNKLMSDAQRIHGAEELARRAEVRAEEGKETVGKEVELKEEMAKIDLELNQIPRGQRDSEKAIALRRRKVQLSIELQKLRAAPVREVEQAGITRRVP